MAIFHCSVSHGSRKGGQSGAAKVDYIMRCGKYIVDAGEVIGACAGHLPSWAGGNPRMFFAAADEYERLNGRLFTQALFAIPNELSDRDALLLAYHYAEAATKNGAPYALAVHRGGVEVVDGETVSAAPQEADEEGLPPHNRHGHLLICERIDDGLERTAREWFRRANKTEPALGGAAKDRTMNGGDWVPEVRRLCADYINYGLKRAGVSERVTCESHETRIARAEAAGDEETAERLRLNPPGIHLGPTAWAIEKGRPGRPARASWRGELNRTIAAGGERLRGEVDELNAKLTQLDVQAEGVNERLEAARRVAAVQFEQRAKALQGTSIGGEILNAVHAEMVGESAAPPSVMQRGEMLEAAEQRFGAVLDLREEGFQETSVGSRYLDDATQSILGARQSPTLPQRELIITTAEGRLTQDLDRREAMLRASVACAYVLGAGQLERADEYGSVLTLVQREQLVDTAERRLEAEREEVRRELDRREEALRAMSTGADHLSAAARELFGEEQAEALADRESMIDEAERRVEEELRGREVELRSVPLGAQYLSEAEQEGLGEGAAVLAAHDVIVTRTEQRLEREMDSRERALVSSAGSDEVLLQAFSELWADDEDFGDGSSLPERWRILERAERWHGKDRAEDEEQSAAVDDVEAMLKETATGARHLAAARQEVVDEGQEPSSLTARETVVRRAWSRVEREQDDREASLSDRRCGGGRDDVDGAVLCAMKLAELEEGEQQSARPHPGRREQALAWAERQMDRVDALREAEALELVGRPRRPADIEQSLDVAEKQQHETAERRRGRVAALSEDERVFFDEKLAALDPQQREKPAHVDAAVDHARARVAALDEENERRRAVIEQTPGDGYARLLAAGFAKASRQQKVEALTAMEAGVAEDFDRREERIRSDGEGEAFLRRGRREVLGDAERQPETLPERGRVIAAAEQERERQQHWEERRDAGVDALERLPGGLDLFHAHLADRDPEWDRKRNDRSSREHIDAALAAARSDTARLGRLRDVLSNEVDAARYREELGKVAGQFKTSDLDNALAAGEQERQERETRQWGEERDAGVQALERLPGGLNLYHAHLADRDPEWDRKRNNKSSREHIDAALTAARSDDGRLDRLRVVLSNEVDAARYREELGKVAGQFKTSDLDRALEAAEQERQEREIERRKAIKAQALRTAAMAERRRQAAAQRRTRLQELFDLPGGDEAFFAALDERKPGWRESGTQRADIDGALDLAEQRVDRTQAATAEHEVVVVVAEEKFPEATSAAWRQTRERFPPAATHARVLSGRLADRARARALAAERTEPAAPPALLQRLFEWLRKQVEELLRRLGLVKAEKPRPIPAPAASMPVPEMSSSAGSPPVAVERGGARPAAAPNTAAAPQKPAAANREPDPTPPKQAHPAKERERRAAEEATPPTSSTARPVSTPPPAPAAKSAPTHAVPPAPAAANGELDPTAAPPKQAHVEPRPAPAAAPPTPAAPRLTPQEIAEELQKHILPTDGEWLAMSGFALTLLDEGLEERSHQEPVAAAARRAIPYLRSPDRHVEAMRARAEKKLHKTEFIEEWGRQEAEGGRPDRDETFRIVIARTVDRLVDRVIDCCRRTQGLGRAATPAKGSEPPAERPPELGGHRDVPRPAPRPAPLSPASVRSEDRGSRSSR